MLTSGSNVIADVLFLEAGWWEEARRLWRPFEPLWIALKPPLDVSEAWEARREATLAGRPTGLARGLSATVYAHPPFDLELDPSRHPAERTAQAVASWLRSGRSLPFDQMLGT